MFETPILYLIFNRPNETIKSFEAIKKIKPKTLYIAADGPRKTIISDIVDCEKVRKYVLTNIDWECDVKTLFRNENLGCGKAVQRALDWFFLDVEMGIIIEDDIIANPNFFKFASLMLKEYKYDSRIFSINGNNLAYKNKKNDYGLTRYFNMWGWATWKRSNDLVKLTWPKYNATIDFKKNSDFVKKLTLSTIYPHGEWVDRWNVLFDITKNGKLDTWDYQWVYTCLKNDLYCIRTNHNWIVNIGFNENSTHTVISPHNVFEQNNSKESVDKKKIFSGDLKIDKNYELVNVAHYWQGIEINYKSLFLKLIKKIKRL